MSTPTDDERYVDLTRDNLNAALARASQAEQERDALRDEVQRATVIGPDQFARLGAQLHQAEQERDAARCAAELLQGELSAAVAELRAVEQERDATRATTVHQDLYVGLKQKADAARAERDQANNEVDRLRDWLAAAVAEHEQSRGLRTALEAIANHEREQSGYRTGVCADSMRSIARAALGSTTEPEETRPLRTLNTGLDELVEDDVPEHKAKAQRAAEPEEAEK